MRSPSDSPLGSLSSPSPSPSPAPESRQAPGSSSAKRSLSPPTNNGAGLDSTSELSELTEEEQEVEPNDGDDVEEEEDDDTNAGSRRRPVRRGGGRRKRGGIVPAPMWHWYKAKKPTSENGTTQPEEEEEEEEEVAGPPRVMEEEEDEEEEEDDDNDTSIRPGPRVNGVEHEGDEDPASLASVNDDLQRALGKRFPPRNADSRAAQRQRIASQSQHAQDSEEEDDADLEDEEEDGDAEEDGDVPQLNLDAGDADPGNDTDSDVDADVTIGEGVLANMTPMDVDGNVDITAPPPATVAPTLAAAAASSIMAGSSVLASATPSPDSSLSGSAASSRSGSPAAEKGDDEEEDEDEDEDEEEEDGDVTKRVEDDDDADETIPSTAPAAETKVAGEAEEADDAEVASALHDELDLEMDADLQPAHRAEALDVLATIELKFALLRERVYVEKMEGIAWEEALVADGTHPELVYLHTELSRREAKRKDLASRQRAYDAACISRKRKMDEDYIWGWWKFARDELQTDMISEHKRKYRRLERDRRALGQAQPVRHIPTVPREVPPAPSLRQIVNKVPYPGNRTTSKKRDQAFLAGQTPLVYPELSTLSSNDINSDLEFLYQNRRAPFDSHVHRMGMSMTVSGTQHLGPTGPPMASMEQQRLYDPYTMSIDTAAGQTPVPRMPPPLATQYGHSFPAGPGRPQHQQPPHGHSHGQFTADQDMPLVVGPGGQSQYFNGPGGQGPSNQMHPLGISRPISPVHVGGGGPGVPPAGTGKQWPGDSRMPPLHHSSGKPGPEYGRMGLPEGRDEWDREKRERDQERERAKTRERNERERDREQYELERDREQERNYLMQQQQQHRHAPPHQHSHAAASSPHQHQPPAPHHHHRPHHHHVVHHHHSQPSGTSGSQTIPPLSIPATGSVPSPRAPGARDYEPSRSHPSDVLNLSSSKPGSSTTGAQPWKRDETSSLEYRDIRARQGSRPSSTHPVSGVYEERDRPLATPFAMAPSSQTMPSAGPPANGQSASTGHSPRMPSWSDDHGARMPSSSYSTGPLGRGSPIGLSPPRSRPPAPRSPSALNFPGPMRSPQRYAQPGPMTEPPPLHSLSSLGHGGSSLSTPSSPGLKSRRPVSPPPGKLGMSAAVASPMYSPPPRLVGPGRTSTPTTLGPSADIHNGVHPSTAASQNTSAFSRNASPLMAFNSPSHPGQSAVTSRPPPNGNNSILPAPKINAVQMVDGP